MITEASTHNTATATAHTHTHTHGPYFFFIFYSHGAFYIRSRINRTNDHRSEHSHLQEGPTPPFPSLLSFPLTCVGWFVCLMAAHTLWFFARGLGRVYDHYLLFSFCSTGALAPHCPLAPNVFLWVSAIFKQTPRSHLATHKHPRTYPPVPTSHFTDNLPLRGCWGKWMQHKERYLFT